MRDGSKSVAAFSLLYLLIAAFYCFMTDNWEFLLYIEIILVLAVGVLSVDDHVHLSRGVKWCISIFGLFHLLGGIIHIPESWLISGDRPVLYNLWLIPYTLRYDQALHAFGYAGIAWMCWQILRFYFPKARPTFHVLAICVLCSMGVGAINEIVEYVAVRLNFDTNVGGYDNTLGDLIANLIGSIVAALVIRWWPDEGRPKHVPRMAA